MAGPSTSGIAGDTFRSRLRRPGTQSNQPLAGMPWFGRQIGDALDGIIDIEAACEASGLELGGEHNRGTRRTGLLDL
jgi:hypothetical protein